MAPLAPDRFFMRPMNLDDSGIVAGWLLDMDDLALFDRSMTVPLNAQAVRESWKADLAEAKFPTAFWFIAEAIDGTPVAIGGLHSINYVNGDAVPATLVAKPARGRGLGLRITIALTDLAFDRLRLRRITTFFRSDNLRTERLVRQVGFQEEGRLRQAWFAGGHFFDCVAVGLLRAEWHARRPKLLAQLDNAVEVVFAPPSATPVTVAPGGGAKPKPSRS